MAVVTCTSLALSANSVFRAATSINPVMRNVMPKLEGDPKTKPVSLEPAPETVDSDAPVKTVADALPAEVSAEPAPQEPVTEVDPAITPAEDTEEETQAEPGDPTQEVVAPEEKAVKKTAKRTKSKKK